MILALIQFLRTINQNNGVTSTNFLQNQESNLLKKFASSTPGNYNDSFVNNRVDRVDHSRVNENTRESGGVSGLFDKAITKVNEYRTSRTLN